MALQYSAANYKYSNVGLSATYMQVANDNDIKVIAVFLLCVVSVVPPRLRGR